MLPIRVVLTVSVFLLLSPRREQTSPAFGVTAGTRLDRKLESGYTMELDTMRVTLNGEEMPAESFGDFHVHLEREQSLVIHDLFEAVEAGRPVRLTRDYEELGARRHSLLTTEDGDENDDQEYSSALEGKRVVFTWDPQAEAFDATYAEGSDGDEELLDALEEDMDLRGFLPPSSVAVGASWDVEARAFGAVLDPGGDLALQADDEEDEDTSDTDARLRENLEGKVRATYAGTEELDGRAVAVITLEIDTRTHAEEEMDPGEMPEGASGTSGIRTGMRLAGELRWDLEHGHALALELSGETDLEMKQEFSGEMEGERLEQGQVWSFTGSMRFSMTFTRE